MSEALKRVEKWEESFHKRTAGAYKPLSEVVSVNRMFNEPTPSNKAGLVNPPIARASICMVQSANGCSE